jgi:hypothetical protein
MKKLYEKVYKFLILVLIGALRPLRLGSEMKFRTFFLNISRVEPGRHQCLLIV